MYDDYINITNLGENFSEALRHFLQNRFLENAKISNDPLGIYSNSFNGHIRACQARRFSLGEIRFNSIDNETLGRFFSILNENEQFGVFTEENIILLDLDDLIINETISFKGQAGWIISSGAILKYLSVFNINTSSSFLN